MERSVTAPRAGSPQAEQAEAMDTTGDRRHYIELRELVRLGDFLAPELHRQHGGDEAATAVREWADDDVETIAEAEAIARYQHRDYSAEILRRARVRAA